MVSKLSAQLVILLPVSFFSLSYALPQFSPTSLPASATSCSLANWACVDRSSMCLAGIVMPCSKGTMCVSGNPCTAVDDGSWEPDDLKEGWECDDGDDDESSGSPSADTELAASSGGGSAAITTPSASPSATSSPGSPAAIPLSDAAVLPSPSSIVGPADDMAQPTSSSTLKPHAGEPTGVRKEAVHSSVAKPAGAASSTAVVSAASTPETVNAISGGQYTGTMTGGWMTTYTGGNGDCGIIPADQEFYVAINFDLFENYPAGSRSICGKKIEIEYHGVTTPAAVYDKCQACKTAQDIDLNTALWLKVFSSLPQCAGGSKIGEGQVDTQCNIGAAPTWSWV